MNLNSREAGILLHITSLPGEGLVGNLGEAAFRFVDFLRDSGHSVWQILPFGPPARGNSPYSALSAFAGNPLLISPELLEQDGLLPAGSCLGLPSSSQTADFAAWESVLLPLLKLSYNINSEKLNNKLEDFRAAQNFWLSDYSHFMALRDFYGEDLASWPRPILVRDRAAIASSRAELSDSVAFHEYIQFLFFSQWESLHSYANSRGVRIFGDVPIYVDIESADLWANPDIFLLDENHRPVCVAGVPPDAFSEDGQLWGNPLYDWDALRKSGYNWWIARLKHTASYCDMLRIDHFRGLCAYWAVSASALTAREGEWQKGPGLHFLNAVKEALPGANLIAEDLGILDDGVRALLHESGLPGLSVLEFAFSPWEDSAYLPHNITEGRVAYIGTHDNDTALGWLESGPASEVARAVEYLNLDGKEDKHKIFLRALYNTAAHLVIAQMQDVLGLSSESRMNIPSRREGSWTYRADHIPTELTGWLRGLCRETGR